MFLLYENHIDFTILSLHGVSRARYMCHVRITHSHTMTPFDASGKQAF